MLFPLRFWIGTLTRTGWLSATAGRLFNGKTAEEQVFGETGPGKIVWGGASFQVGRRRESVFHLQFVTPSEADRFLLAEGLRLG
jgi:hypothetical protein